MKCIVCGKEINRSYGSSGMCGNYCQSCWQEIKSNERDRMLDTITEMNNWNAIKDQQIAELQKQLEESEKMNKILYNENESAEKILRMSLNEQTREILELQQQLKSQPKEIVEKIRKGIKDNMICFWKDEDRKSFNRILKSILKEYLEFI